jgi:hypothetical protein
MTFKGRVYLVVFVLLGFVAELLFLGYLATQVLGLDGSSKQYFFPVSVVESNQLRLISIVPVAVEGVSLGRVAVYDDSTTPRSADYLELYNNTDDLVAVSWFDRFNIERTAVDCGLLEGRNELGESLSLFSMEARLTLSFEPC